MLVALVIKEMAIELGVQEHLTDRLKLGMAELLNEYLI
jgi:hypothetical protein